ncbi:MAG TPA: choice-of-anchor D domain-containing protein [Candidatus Acidoferrum sp.]|nr:choice-of-anchor D domain-containing protein [Candidatus Acidoferrum sp.]
MADARFTQLGNVSRQATAGVGQAVAQPVAIDFELVAAVLAQNPRFDPAKSHPATLDLTGLSVEDQAKAKAAIEALRREINIFPEFDYNAALAPAAPGSQTAAQKRKPKSKSSSRKNGAFIQRSRGSGAKSASPGTVVPRPVPFQNPVREAVSKFLASAQDFDFQTTRIDTYLRNQASSAVVALTDETGPVVVNQLKRMQRVFRVTPEPKHITALLAEGLDSAHAIATVPQKTFVMQFGDKLGDAEQAKAIHSQATVMTASALNLYRQVQSALSDVTPRAIGPVASTVSAALKALPDWENLFGSLSFCDCKECQSVLGAAAYFVDLLQFLKKSTPNDKGQTPLDILVTRRPDLPFIRLNCENTTTLLPYIDLVNEILESYVASADPKTTHSTGDATTDELSLNPQYVIDQAYVTLSQAVYPFALPFDRPLEMSRAYLGFLNSSRFEVMSTFQLGGSASDFTKGIPSGLALACEDLGVSVEEHVILTGTDLTGNPVSSTRALPEFYGFPKATANAALVAALQKAEAFLASTGLSYLDVVGLVKTRFVNASQAITLQVPSDADPCDLSQTTLNGLDATALQRIHRFLRLHRKTGWRMEDLDKTIHALWPLGLGSADIDDALLVKLAFVTRLQNNLNIPVAQLTSFWFAIDVAGRDAFYLQLFQNKTVLSPVDPAFALLYSNPLSALPAGVTAASLAAVTSSISYAGGALRFTGVMTKDQKTQLIALATTATDPNYAAYQLAIDNLFQGRNSSGLALAPTDPNAKISLHVPAMLAALRVSSTDFAAMIATEKLGDILDLQTLSQYYRFAVLARALKISVADLSVLEKLAGANLVQPSDPASLSAFVDKAQKVLRSAFSVAQLNYLYCGVNDPNQGIAPLDGDVFLFLTNLQTALNKVTDGTSVIPDPSAGLASVLQQKMAAVLDAASVTETMGLLDGTFQFSADLGALPAGVTLPTGITYDSRNKKLLSQGAISDLETARLVALSKDAAYQTAVRNLARHPRDFIISRLARFLNPRDAITQLITNASLSTAVIVNTALTANVATYTAANDFAPGDSVTITGTTNGGGIFNVAGQIVQTSSPTQFTLAIVHGDVPSAVDSGTATSAAISNADKQKYVLVRFLARANVIKQMLAGNFGLDVGITELLLEVVLNAQSGSGKAIKDFLSLAAPSQAVIVNTALTVNVATYTAANDFAPGDSVTITGTTNGGGIFNVAGQIVQTSSPAQFTLAIVHGDVPSAVDSGTATPAAISKPTVGDPAWISYELIHKAALLVKGFRMTAKEVTYLADNGPDFANFDFNALPVGGVQPNPAQLAALFAQWLRLYDLFRLRDGVADGEAVFDVFQAAAHPSSPPPTPAGLATQLAAATGWDNGETLILTGSAGFSLTVGDFKNEIKLVPLLSCWNLIQRLGVSAARFFHWAGDPPDATLANDLKNANEIKTAARANYGDETWLTAGKIPVNRLRDAQRAALMAFVQNALQFTDSGQLFDYFLIDVQMSSCMMTSRIVQAVDSVQLFVQRCLMNLESNLDANNKETGVSPSAIDSNQWQKWRKYYRVWEANREVFLYPENWIEPELRDDKSPFFKDLENELLQNDVTAQTVEDAFRNYLQQLDEVSRLEIVGTYHDDDAGILHVFGRTFHTPPTYYYRQLTNTGVWTAWDKVPLDIQGDDLIPVVYERRLYLFWPIITTKAQENQNSVSNASSPLSHCEIQLAWGRYQNGKWSAKRLSENILFYPTKDGPIGKLPLDIPSSKLPNVESFVFKGIITNQGASEQHLAIQAYVEQAPRAEPPKWSVSASNASSIVVNVTSEGGDALTGVNVSVRNVMVSGDAPLVAATQANGSCPFNLPDPPLFAIYLYSVAVSVPPDYWSVSDDTFLFPIPFLRGMMNQVTITFKLSLRGTGVYSQFAEFCLNECAGAVASAYVDPPAVLLLPSGTHRDAMMLVENLKGSPPITPVGYLDLLSQDQNNVTVLGSTPSVFHLLPPHQLAQFLLPPPPSGAAPTALLPAATPQWFTVSTSGLSFGIQQVGTASSPQTITLTGQIIEGAQCTTATVISGANAEDFHLQSNTCQNFMYGLGATCTITVTFSPSVGGNRNATLTITVTPGGMASETQTVPLSGTGIGVPGIGLAPASVDFGNQVVGATSATQIVTVTSTGTAPLFLTSNTTSGDFAATSSCPLNPAPANCMSMYPSGYVPFSSVFYTSAPDAAGNRVVVGSMTVAAYQALSLVPMPNVTNQVFCAILQLTPGVFVQAYVPTDPERHGDFSSFSVPLTDPTNNQPFPGNVIPPNRIPGVFGWRITSLTPVSVSGTCKLQVSFTPTGSGPRPGTLTITDNATGSPHTITLSGTGVVPSVDLSPSTLDFGSQAVGSASASQTVTLKNTSDVAVTITNIGISGANSGDFTLLNNCGASLLAKASCTISVTFMPSAGGSRSAMLTVTDNATGASQTVALKGVGVVPGIALYPPSLTFGNQPVSTTSAPQTVTLTNTGNSQLTITSITCSGDFVQTNNYSGVLMPSASCTINVTFSPTTSGARTGTLTIVDSSPGSPQTVNLVGSGTQPAVTLSPTSLAFTAPTVGTTSPPQTVTLKNSGTAPLNIISVSIGGADFGDFFYTFSGGNTLAPGDSIPISITFRPSGGGTRSGQLVITDDATGSPHAVNLTGNVSGADLSLSPTTLSFARQAVGTTSPPQTVTVVNSGGSPLTINSISISGDFAQATSCGNSVAAGASCAIAVTFKPTGAGMRTGMLSIVDTAPGSPHSVSLSGAGLSSEPYEFFYQDDRRTYYASLPQGLPAAQVAKAVPQVIAGAVGPALATPQLQFYTHFHPHICAFIESLNRDGIHGLLILGNQQLTNDGIGSNTPTVFQHQYSPIQSVVVPPYPIENVDFGYGGAYDIYNWELFFHAPMLVAGRLASNQKFQDAQQWYHYVFNPTLGNNFWQVLPFQATPKDSIEDLLKLLEYTGNDPNIIQQQNNFKNQLNEWMNNPFNPHAIGRLRLIAYQKNVVMKYLDNLIAWGDQLFRQYTMETVNQATQLYVMAQEILGPRPQLVPSRQGAQDKTYNDLAPKLDDFSNVLVQLENDFPFSVDLASNSGDDGLGLTGTFYFCIPNNAQLLAYWDTVADRLFKIRHCMNTEGVVSPLPLFAPPISPGLLVRAAAEGVDLASALNDIEAATPYYRFTYMLQKAFELCSEVRAFGGSLLSALEKKDGELLALLRATQETGLLNAVLKQKQQQLDEANANVQALQKSLLVTQARYDFYSKIPFMIPEETAHLVLTGASGIYQGIAQLMQMSASGSATVPDFYWGVAGMSSPVVLMKEGGSNVSSGLANAAKGLEFYAGLFNTLASMSATMGNYRRRAAEWQLQTDVAHKELDQINQQITAANIRAQIAQTEIDNHNLQISNAQAVQNFLQSKYTNQDLYAWMVSQTSSVFFQCYQLAYDMAKRTEKAFRFERGLTDSSFIAFGYWDNLKKGLLSGEQLYLDLKRLEAAYLDQNKRDYEISKHISLVLVAPLSLIALKETGQCTLDLAEALFDADYPGHFMRRVKSVSLTIPCVTGPYTSVNCTLTLLKNKVRVLTDTQPAYLEQTSAGQSEPRFIYDFAATQSIATSSGQNDSGMFEVNFRDERYLPFEGAGAISTWQIDLPKDTNAFDFETISDLILNLNYTARDGGDALRLAARSAAASQPPAPVPRLFSLKHEFPSEWYKFANPPSAAASQTLTISLGIERFPFLYRGKTIAITNVDLYLRFKDIYDPNTYKLDPSNPTPFGDYAKGTPLTVYVTPAPALTAASAASLQSAASYLNGLPHASLDITSQPGTLGPWLLEAREADISKIAASLQTTVTVDTTTHYRLRGELIEDVIFVCTYKVQ